MEESSQPGAWAVFLSQIFEQEGSVAGILDTLKDGPPKLQQAYLNIINLLFSNNSNIENELQINGDKLMKKTEMEIEKTLYSIRHNLSRPEGALPCILRLIEQGGSSSVRSKALLAAQLLCRYSPNLLTGKRIKIRAVQYSVFCILYSAYDTLCLCFK